MWESLHPRAEPSTDQPAHARVDREAASFLASTIDYLGTELDVRSVAVKMRDSRFSDVPAFCSAAIDDGLATPLSLFANRLGHLEQDSPANRTESCQGV